MEENNIIDQEDKDFEEFKRVMELLWFGNDHVAMFDEAGNYITQLYDFDGDILDLIKRPPDPRYQKS